MHRNRRLIQIILAGAIIVTVIFVIRGLRSQKPDPLPKDFTADGLGMTQTIFDADNRRMIELKSSESRQGEKDRIYMKNLEAMVLKHGRMSEDIRVHGDTGYVENNYHNLLIQSNAEIDSKKFNLKSDSFYLKNRAQLSTDKRVSFKLRDMNGVAKKGMLFYLRHNVIKLFSANGVHHRRGEDYEFKADTLWFVENERKLILENNALVKGPDSVLQGDWISITFDEELKYVVSTRCQGKAHMRTEARQEDGEHIRDMRCGIITAEHGEDGKISRLTLNRNGIVHIQDPQRHTRIISDIMHMEFTPGGDTLKSIVLPSPGEIDHQGSTDFSASSQRMRFLFHQGKLEHWLGEGEAQLRNKEFSCRSDSLAYTESQKILKLKGKECRVIQGGNVFLATGFTMHTEKKWLRSEEGVRTTFHPKTVQPPFTQSHFFVRSRQMTYFDRTGTLHFKGTVQLFQESARLTCEELILKNGKDILAKNQVDFAFTSDTDRVSAGGSLLVFDPEHNSLQVSGKARLSAGKTLLTAESLVIEFNKESRLSAVQAAREVKFEKEAIAGSADLIRWDYAAEKMRFTGNARLSKRNGGDAEGELLDLDLKTNAVRVESGQQRRTVTLLEE